MEGQRKDERKGIGEKERESEKVVRAKAREWFRGITGTRRRRQNDGMRLKDVCELP